MAANKDKLKELGFPSPGEQLAEKRRKTAVAKQPREAKKQALLDANAEALRLVGNVVKVPASACPDIMPPKVRTRRPRPCPDTRTFPHEVRADDDIPRGRRAQVPGRQDLGGETQ